MKTRAKDLFKSILDFLKTDDIGIKMLSALTSLFMAAVMFWLCFYVFKG